MNACAPSKVGISGACGLEGIILYHLKIQSTTSFCGFSPAQLTWPIAQETKAEGLRIGLPLRPV